MTEEEYENFDKLAHLEKFLFLDDFFVSNALLLENAKVFYIKNTISCGYYAGVVLNSMVEIQVDLTKHSEITSLKMEILIDGKRSSIHDLKSLMSELRKTIIVDDE